MLETIKEYATERLDAQPEFAAAAREAHARYFVELADDVEAAADLEGATPTIGSRRDRQPPHRLASLGRRRPTSSG